MDHGAGTMHGREWRLFARHWQWPCSVRPAGRTSRGRTWRKLLSYTAPHNVLRFSVSLLLWTTNLQNKEKNDGYLDACICCLDVFFRRHAKLAFLVKKTKKNMKTAKRKKKNKGERRNEPVAAAPMEAAAHLIQATKLPHCQTQVRKSTGHRQHAPSGPRPLLSMLPLNWDTANTAARRKKRLVSKS